MKDIDQSSTSSFNLAWYDCMMAQNDKLRQSMTEGADDDESVTSKSESVAEELISQVADDYRHRIQKQKEDNGETVIMAKEHADALQEQMKEYYTLLESFESMKMKNEQLERELKIHKNGGSNRSLEQIPDDSAVEFEFEKQIDSLKSVVMNLREAYERKLPVDIVKPSKKNRNNNNPRNSSMKTCSTAVTTRCSDESIISIEKSQFSLFSKLVSDLRSEVKPEKSRKKKPRKRPPRSIVA